MYVLNEKLFYYKNAKEQFFSNLKFISKEKSTLKINHKLELVSLNSQQY